MRKLLLASVATFGASAAMVGLAHAQSGLAPVPASDLQGTVITPENSGSYTFGDNNYMSGTMSKGAVANPTPGTMVIRLGVRVFVNASENFSNLNQVFTPAAAATATSPALNGGRAKLSPTQFGEYMRIYPGVDAMATNGLRYGAAVELRQNFGSAATSSVSGTTGSISTAAANGGTSYTSTQTVYVRRAFAYVAGDTWGIVRFGEMDGLIGTYDNGGQTTGVYLSPTGTIVGGDLQSMGVGNAYMSPFFGAQSGNEYGNTKVVYLSPSIAGFDFGFQYAPNPFNGYAVGSGLCASAAGSTVFPSTATPPGGATSLSGDGSVCPNAANSSTNAYGSRVLNQYAVGARYSGVLGGVGILGYGVYMGSGTLDYTGPVTPAALGTATVPGSKYNGSYDGLNLGSFGVNISYAGFAVFGNTLFGAVNGTLAARPKNAVAAVGWVAGVKYVAGPWSIGALYGAYDSQGAQQLTGISQRHENVFYIAGTYAVAPGLLVALDYVYGTRYQSQFNFATNAVGGGVGYNKVQSQGVMLSTSVKW